MHTFKPEVQHQPAPDGLSGSRFYWSWITIMIGLMLAVLDSTLTNVALPTIAMDFAVAPSATVWIVNGYQLAIIISLLPLATLGEIYSYKRIYLLGVALFTIASIACVFAVSFEMLAIGRIVQGFGAAGLMSVNTALLRYIVPQAKFGTAIGLNTLIVAVSASIGPTLAGLILHFATWPWLFVINIPLGILVVAIGSKNLPDSDRSPRKFDAMSAVLCALTIGLLILMIDGAGHGLPSHFLLLLACCCVVAGVLLVRRSSHMTDPLLPLDLLRIPAFSLSVCTSVVSFLGQMIAFISLPFLFQNIYGFKPIEVGLLIMPWPIALAIVAPISGKLSDKYSPAILGMLGLFTFACGMALLGLLPTHPSVFDICWRMAICGLGFGLFQTPNNRLIVTSAPRKRSGAASGMLGTARVSGQALGAALIGYLLARWGVENIPNFLLIGAGCAAAAALLSVSRHNQ